MLDAIACLLRRVDCDACWFVLVMLLLYYYAVLKLVVLLIPIGGRLGLVLMLFCGVVARVDELVVGFGWCKQGWLWLSYDLRFAWYGFCLLL